MSYGMWFLMDLIFLISLWRLGRLPQLFPKQDNSLMMLTGRKTSWLRNSLSMVLFLTNIIWSHYVNQIKRFRNVCKLLTRKLDRLRSQNWHVDHSICDLQYKGRWIYSRDAYQLIAITNELHCLGEVIRPTKQVYKNSQLLAKAWESKVNAITEAWDLKRLTMDELIGNLKTYELKKKQDKARSKLKKEKNLVLKSVNGKSSEEDEDTTYITKIFLKIMRNGEVPRIEDSNRYNRDNDFCHKHGKPGHFVKDFLFTKWKIKNISR